MRRKERKSGRSRSSFGFVGGARCEFFISVLLLFPLFPKSCGEKALSFPFWLMSLLRQLPAARLLARAFPSAASAPSSASPSSSSAPASSISATFARAHASFAARAMATKATAGGLPVEVR